MVAKYNQHMKIARYLDEHPEGITPMDAFSKLRITKLSTRIGEMIRDGYKVEKRMEYRFEPSAGGIINYMRYIKVVQNDAEQNS